MILYHTTSRRKKEENVYYILMSCKQSERLNQGKDVIDVNYMRRVAYECKLCGRETSSSKASTRLNLRAWDLVVFGVWEKQNSYPILK